jgi:glycosyltransferase involved in cell wall biosynthesis
MIQKFAVVIPTYKRHHLLQELIVDITQQTLQPCELVVVDGDANSDIVLKLLNDIEFPKFWQVTYIPSIHGNAPFQRYLGVESIIESEVVIFVDDDIEINQSMVFEKLLIPFALQDPFVAGLSPVITFPNRKVPIKTVKHRSFFPENFWNAQPGEITPLGNRIEPTNSGEDYAIVHWLRGGVMAYRLSSLLPVIYNEDVFSLSYIRCGLGVDDTFLSREVGTRGELLLAFCTNVIHADMDTSKAYPTNAFRLAYARAYSRRFINDHFRVNKNPMLQDRLVLIISLLGNTVISWIKVLQKLTRDNFQYASGYTLGTLRAFSQKPVARNLAPHVNWKNDTQKSLSQSIIVQKAAKR